MWLRTFLKVHKRGFCLWEVKKAVFVCDWNHLIISVLLWEVSTSRSSTVLIVSCINSAESNKVTMYGRGFEKFNSAESHSVRCGFKFNDTYCQGMLYGKIMMAIVYNQSLVQSNSFNPIRGNLRYSALR